jgi:hypothetical protein
MVLGVRQRLAKVALVGAVLMATACGSGSSGSDPGTSEDPSAANSLSAGAGVSAPGQVPSLGETSNSLVLPLTSYYPTPQQVAGLQTMRNELISSCMQSVGFNYPAVMQAPVNFGGDPGRGQFYDFGATSTSFASRNGYHDENVVYPLRTASGAPVPQQGTLSAAEDSAVQRCATHLDSQTGYLDSNWNVLVQDLGVEAWQRANADSRVLAGFKQWSSCMAAKGFDYSTPLRSMVGELGNSNAAMGWMTSAPSQLEIQTATTDAVCKEKTGLLKTWITAVVSYQNASLPANMPQLRASLAEFLAIYHKEQQLLEQEH